jgi:hypothetical protein
MTEAEEKIRRYDKRQRGIALKKRIDTLGNRLQGYGREWQRLAGAFRDYNYPNRFSVEADRSGNREIRVKRPQPDSFSHLPGHVSPMQTIVAVSLSYFDPDGLEKLFQEIEDAKTELATIREFCQKVGDPLD